MRRISLSITIGTLVHVHTLLSSYILWLPTPQPLRIRAFDAVPRCNFVMPTSTRVADAPSSCSSLASVFMCLFLVESSESWTLTLSVPRIDRVSAALAAVLHVPELRHGSTREAEHLHLGSASVVLD